jgi:hypothetical protein
LEEEQLRVEVKSTAQLAPVPGPQLVSAELGAMSLVPSTLQPSLAHDFSAQER